MKVELNKHCAALLLLLLCGSRAAQAQTSYSVSGRIDDPEMEGHEIYLSVYDTNQFIDTAIVRNQHFHMEGVADAPYFARLERYDRKGYANFVLEDSVTIDFQTHQPSNGGPLTQKFLRFGTERDSVFSATEQWEAAYDKQHPDATAAQRTKDFNRRFFLFFDKWIRQESDNGIGEYALREAYIQFYYTGQMEFVQALRSSLSPYLAALEFTREAFDLIINTWEKTSPGKPFIDIAGVTVEGTPVRLSQYIGKGRYVLVDFWASWCSPCKAEARIFLKPLWEKYKDGDKLTILGIAVRDELDKTKKALAKEGYTWPQILDAGTVPMEQYGIIGIPHIMLLAPDGTILARNLRGNAIEEEIQKHLTNK